MAEKYVEGQEDAEQSGGRLSSELRSGNDGAGQRLGGRTARRVFGHGASNSREGAEWQETSNEDGIGREGVVEFSECIKWPIGCRIAVGRRAGRTALSGQEDSEQPGGRRVTTLSLMSRDRHRVNDQHRGHPNVARNCNSQL